MLLLYILWEDWPIPAGIGIHPTKAWLTQLVNFKNAFWHFMEEAVTKVIDTLTQEDFDGAI